MGWTGWPTPTSESGWVYHVAFLTQAYLGQIHYTSPTITLGYKQEKARRILELKESSDPTVKNALVPTHTGRKWQVDQEVAKAISKIQHQEIVGGA